MSTVLAPQIFALDLNLKQGSGATVTLTTVDKAGAVISNVSGYTVRAQIRRVTNGPVLFEWNTTPGSGQGTAALTYSAGPPPASQTVLILTAAQSQLFRFRLAQWDCYLIPPVGEPTCIAAGVVRVQPAMTTLTSAVVVPVTGGGTGSTGATVSSLAQIYTTAVTTQPATGQPVATLNSVANLAAGWIVVLGADVNTGERLTVLSVSGNTVTFTANIAGTHPTTELVAYSNQPLDNDYLTGVTYQQVTGQKRFMSTVLSGVASGTGPATIPYMIDGFAPIRSRAQGGGSIIAAARAESKPVIDWVNDSTVSSGYLFHLTQSLPAGQPNGGPNGASSGTLIAIGVQGSGGTGILLAHDGPNGNLLYLDQKGVVSNAAAAAMQIAQASFAAPAISMAITEPSPIAAVQLTAGAHSPIPGESFLSWASGIPASGAVVDVSTGQLVTRTPIVADNSGNTAQPGYWFRGRGSSARLNALMMDEMGCLAGGPIDSGTVLRGYMSTGSTHFSAQLRWSKSTQGLMVAAQSGAQHIGAENHETVADFGASNTGVRLGFGHNVNITGLAVPGSVALSGAGASGGATTYGYRAAAVNAVGTTIASTEVTTTTGNATLDTTNKIIVTWAAVLGANSYKIYGRTAGAELLMATLAAPTRTVTDGVMQAATTRTVTDAAVSLPSGAGSSANVTSATAAFTSADGGAKVLLAGAGYNGYDYYGHIVSVTNPTTAVLSGTLGASVTNATMTVSWPAMHRLTSATAAFTNADVGKGISAPVGAAGATVFGFITTIESATSVLVSFTATTTMTAGTVTITGGTVPVTFTDDGTATPSGALPGSPAGSRFTIQRWQSQTGDTFRVLDESGNTLLSFDKAGHVVAGTQIPPTIAAGAQAATAAVTSGADGAGTFTATTVASPAAGALATITFGTAFTATPKGIHVQPLSAAGFAAGLYVSAVSTTAFTVSCANTAAASTALAFSVTVVG